MLHNSMESGQLLPPQHRPGPPGAFALATGAVLGWVVGRSRVAGTLVESGGIRRRPGDPHTIF